MLPYTHNNRQHFLELLHNNQDLFFNDIQSCLTPTKKIVFTCKCMYAEAF